MLPTLCTLFIDILNTGNFSCNLAEGVIISVHKKVVKHVNSCRGIILMNHLSIFFCFLQLLIIDYLQQGLYIMLCQREKCFI